jgi:hypothetical protein
MPFSTPPPPPPLSTRAIKSTKTPPISLEFVLRACGLYELSFTRLGALFLAVLSCFSPNFVLLRPQPRRDRHPTFSRSSGTPPSFGYGDIFGGNLGAASLRDTVFFGTLHVSHTTLRPSGTPRPSGTIGLWARPTPPHQQPRKQYRTSFPKPPLWETPQSPLPPPLAPGPTTTTSDGAACLAVTPPPTAPAVPPPPSAMATSSDIQTRQAFAIRFLREVALRPHHSSAFGHDWALGSTHPVPPPRKQYRTSFPKPPLHLRARLGSGLDPSLPNNLGSSIGQAFHAPPAAA